MSPKIMATALDYHLTQMVCRTFAEALVLIRFAQQSLRQGIAALEPSESAKFSASGLLALLEQAERWIANPSDGADWGDVTEAAMQLAQAHYPRGMKSGFFGGDAACYGVVELLRAIAQADEQRKTGGNDLNDVQGSANLVVKWARDTSAAAKDDLIREQCVRALIAWPGSVPS